MFGKRGYSGAHPAVSTVRSPRGNAESALS
nr:MAG TPA: hypothetical protein [Caudoviricetes sp.]